MMNQNCLPDPSTSTFVPPSQRGDAPLAGILPPELEDIDPRKFFPDFVPDGRLRFSRIFASNQKPTTRNQIWWTSRTFKKEAANKKGTQESEDSAAISTISKQQNGEEEEQKDEMGEAEKEESGLGGWALRIGPPPKKEDCCTDEYELLCAPNLDELLEERNKEHTNEEDDEAAPPWRFGPAQMWYDRMGVPPNPANFDYGMKKRGTALKNAAGTSSTMEEDDRDFLPVNLVHWEDDIIMDGEQAKQKLIEELSSVKLPRCGWIPTPLTRTHRAFVAAWKNKTFLEYLANPTRVAGQSPDDCRMPVVDSTHSLFPFDNYELECTRWEDDIIWDTANMPSIPKPRVLTLDYEDDPRIFGVPDEAAQAEGAANDSFAQQATTSSAKLGSKEREGGIKKSKLILAQVLKRQRQEEEEQIETQIAQVADKDPFNLSNDEYYAPKANAARTQRSLTSLSIQHSLPAQNLHLLLFPLLHNAAQMRNFHRVQLARRMLHGAQGRHLVAHSLARHIRLTAQRRKRAQMVGEEAFDTFQMRELHDITGRDGTLVLMEYTEEHPPLLNQLGMASKIRNYYKRKLTKEQEQSEFAFGETAFSHATPFLGALGPDESLQALENNMFRATVFQHSAPDTDFLLILNKHGLFMRPFTALFAVGQQLALFEVPNPNSKRANDFHKDFMMSHIYRLFWRSEENPRRVRGDELRQMFPGQEGVIRKNLKPCAETKRIDGQDYWILKEDFRLPSREEVANMVTPEAYCAHASMLAAVQRLKDAGYGEKYLHMPENADDSDDQIGEDEIKCAPWNTTKAYIGAVKGKNFLDQTGVADPTGAGLGFSFVRVSTKPPKVKEEVEKEKDAPKKLVTGTNADLRKLSLKEARQMCREFGLTEEEINSLERWDVIDVIRTLSTQAAQGSTDAQVKRFARGSARATFADMQNKHKEHCQRVFERQNKWLSSRAPAQQQQSDDEWHRESEEDGDGPIGRRLYSTTVTLNQAEKRKLEFEREERERLDLQRMIRGEVTKSGSSVSAAAKEAVAAPQTSVEGARDTFTVPNPQSPSANASILATDNGAHRRLKIYRTIRNSDGTESTRIETVTHPQLIEAYVRIRSTRDDNFIKVYAQMDDQYKEEKRKERKRLQHEQHSRRGRKPNAERAAAEMKASQERQLVGKLLEQHLASVSATSLATEAQPGAAPPAQPAPQKPGPKPKPKPPVEKKEKPPPPPPKQKDLKITCSSCGAIGHMKTNRNCPLYGKDEDLASKTVGEICQPSSSRLSDIPDEEGDRLPSGELIEVEGTRLKISKKVYKHAEKERKDALRLHIPRKILESEALKQKQQKAKKLGAKKASKAALAEQQQALELSAVSAATVPPQISLLPAAASDTTEIATSKMRAPLTLSISIASTLSTQAGGPLSALSSASSTGGGGAPFSAGSMKRRGTIEEADYLLGPLKSVHRRRADPRVSMASVLMEIVNELKGVEGSEHFAFPVNIKKVPDYLDVVKKPMDLQQMRKNIAENKYELRRQFLEDMTQILNNSVTYNGPSHPITGAARRMLQHAIKRLEDNEQKLIELEKQINPLLDDDDMVGFSHILFQIVQECKNLPKSAAFHSRVDPKKFPQYNDKIQRPMDLGTIEQNIKDHRYTTVVAFRRDVEQILVNSQIFNGAESAYTLKAGEIVALADQLLEKSRGHLAELEANIQKALNTNDDGAASSAAGDDRVSLASWVSADIATNAERQAPGGVAVEQPALEEMDGGAAVQSPLATGPPPDQLAVPTFYLGDEEEESVGQAAVAEGTGGILQEDLALSGEESEEEERAELMDEEEKAWDEEAGVSAEQFLRSDMHTSGQLNADLALSDSDEDEGLLTAKRPKLEDFDASL